VELSWYLARHRDELRVNWTGRAERFHDGLRMICIDVRVKKLLGLEADSTLVASSMSLSSILDGASQPKS
jgi:hypothetical protein